MINDALRRANKSTTEQKTPSRDTVRLKPIEYAQERNLQSLLMVPLLLVALVAVGGVFYWQFGIRDKESPQNPTPAAKAVKAAAPAQPPQKPAAQAAPTPAVNAPRNEPKPASAPPASPAAGGASREPAPIVLNPAAKPAASAADSPDAVASQTGKPVVKEPLKWPDLELQAIFYRLNNPSVMINGQNLSIGDFIQGVRVHAIDRESATLDFDGVRKVYKTK